MSQAKIELSKNNVWSFRGSSFKLQCFPKWFSKKHKSNKNFKNLITIYKKFITEVCPFFDFL